MSVLQKVWRNCIMEAGVRCPGAWGLVWLLLAFCCPVSSGSPGHWIKYNDTIVPRAFFPSSMHTYIRSSQFGIILFEYEKKKWQFKLPILQSKLLKSYLSALIGKHFVVYCKYLHKMWIYCYLLSWVVCWVMCVCLWRCVMLGVLTRAQDILLTIYACTFQGKQCALLPNFFSSCSTCMEVSREKRGAYERGGRGVARALQPLSRNFLQLCRIF